MGKLSERRASLRNELMEETQKSFDNKDVGSGMYGNIWKKGLVIKEWGCKHVKSDDSPHIIDVIPYEVGENPSKLIPNNVPGKITYRAEYFIHDKVGANEDRVVCPRSFELPCPICEERKQIADSSTLGYKDPRVAELKTVRRCVYNVVVYDNPAEEAKGVQLWICSHWNFERIVSGISKAPRGGGFVAFSDPDVGKSVAFANIKTGEQSVSYEKFQFVDRTKPIPDEILDAAFCLEDLIQVYEYDELEKLYKGKRVKSASTSTTTTTSSNAPVEERKVDPVPVPEKVKDGKCPGSGIIGQDINNLNHCPKCEIYADCVVRAEEIDKKLKGTAEVKVDAPKVETPATPPASETPTTPTSGRTRRV